MKNKLISTLLAVIMLSLCFCIPTSAAEEIPSCVTREEITQAMDKADSVLAGLMSSGMIDLDLKQTVYGVFISDDTLNSVFTALYSAFSENEDTFRLMGVDISLNNVAAGLKNYPDVYAELTSKASWQEVFAAPMSCKWGLTDAEQFGTALAAMLRPFNEILFILLCSGSTQGIISVQGADGYTNALVPLLAAVGCPEIMSQADYTAAARQDRGAMIKNAVKMLFRAVDNILAAPVKNICRYLPSIADYLSNGGISESANALIAPIVIKIGIIPLSGLDKLIEKSGVFTDSSDLTDMFNGMNMGNMGSFTLPEIDLAQLAACTEKTESGYNTDSEAAFVKIIYYAAEAVRQNAAGMTDLPQEAADIIKSLSQKSNEEILKSITGLLTFGAQDAKQDYQWQYSAFTPAAVTYPQNMTRDNFVRTLEMIDSTLSEFLTEFVNQPPLSKTIGKSIYSTDTLTALTTGIYGALGSDDLKDIFALIGFDFSVEAVAAKIKEYNNSAAEALSRYSSWDEVKDIDWSIKNGKRKSFEKSLNAALLPLSGLLDVVLSEGKINLFGAIDIYGSDGYNTAVIPVLEALGCKGESIKTYGEYVTLTDYDKISAVTSPVFDLIDEIIKAPVVTLCSILPNIAYFITNDGLKTAVSNLLYPLTALLEKAGLTDMLPAEMTEFNFDINQMLSQAVSTADMGFELKAPDLSKVAALGTATQKTSAATYAGAPASTTYITADAPAVLLTAARYVVDSIDFSKLDLMSGMTEGDDAGAMSMYTGSITKQLEGKTTDELIEWIYNLLFAETPTVEQEPVNDYIPTIIYQPVKDNKNTIAITVAVLVFVAITGTIIFISKHDFSRKKPKKSKAEKEVTV